MRYDELNSAFQEPTPFHSEAQVKDYTAERTAMIQLQIESRGIKDSRVLEAMKQVPRHLFVPQSLQDQAYNDSPLPIGYGQTISQPYIVALMCEAAHIGPQDKILEIGTGSAYQAAILSFLAQEVFTIEIVSPLGEQAEKCLRQLGYNNVHMKIGDGYAGWPEHAPYDAILITAAASEVPQPLIDQLKVGGRLLMPLGNSFNQQLVRITNTQKGVEREVIAPVIFVPFQRDEIDKE